VFETAHHNQRHRHSHDTCIYWPWETQCAG
jgi:hypothetical protein